MQRIRVKAAFAALAVSALALAGCAGGDTTSPDDNASSEGPIRVVVFGGIGAEGILANNATTSVTAAQASVAAVNEMGGILGREVVIDVIDDTADPTVAVTRLRELMASDERPHVVMNSGPSTVADAMIPILTQERVLSFNIGPTPTSGDPSVSPYNFDLSASVPDYLGSFTYELGERGYENVAILHGSSAYGELFGSLTQETFAEAGFTISGAQGYDNASLDMTPQLESLQATNPDVLVLDAYGAPLGYVLQGIERLGWDIPIMGNTSVSATGLIATEPPSGVLGTDQVRNLTMQVFKSTKFDPAATEVNEAVERMAAAGDILSSLILAYNYDGMLLVKAAAESAGSIDDVDALAAALLDEEVQQAANTQMISWYRFTADSHTPHVAPEDFLFIGPGPLVNGQYQ
ncbi:amino acid ABC transporter substrate-binding protein [Chryseoglobus sp. KN1116]|uniref:Amino acid ABC transporter substrate-binding protein n=2 Tax=Microcella pacifica TaxID=2591847 RepID=A0A9E5JKS1_9MICO|nr:amino acid ABC transporter substrate-binding protein [Microcella pacifica]